MFCGGVGKAFSDEGAERAGPPNPAPLEGRRGRREMSDHEPVVAPDGHVDLGSGRENSGGQRLKPRSSSRVSGTATRGRELITGSPDERVWCARWIDPGFGEPLGDAVR
jgi:hypothetical protein